MRNILSKAVLLLGCLLSLGACQMEDTYSAQNVMDFLNVSGDFLVSDSGIAFTVVDNQSGINDWKKEEGRYCAVFDILNIQMEIRLLSLDAVEICPPTLMPEQQEEVPGQDPVEFSGHSFSGGYLNLLMDVYKAKDGDTVPTLSFQYEDMPNLQQMLLHMYCNSNNENPATTDKKQLETETRYCSVPLYELLKDKQRRIRLIFNKVVDKDGQSVIQADTLRLANDSVFGY